MLCNRCIHDIIGIAKTRPSCDIIIYCALGAVHACLGRPSLWTASPGAILFLERSAKPMCVATSCANCGESITKFPSQIRDKNFCSRICHVEYKNKTGFYKKENHPQWKGATLSLECTHCGKLFYIKRSALDRGQGRGKFCSHDCKRAHNSVSKQCEVCGKGFRIKKSHSAMGHGIYCSMACRTIGFDRRGILKGENSPRYIDGKSETLEYDRRKQHERRAKKKNNGGTYSLQEWNDLCAKYGHRCLACGRSDVELTVDHIVPIKFGGSNDISNLQPLCKSCNSKKNVRIIDYRPNENQEYPGHQA